MPLRQVPSIMVPQNGNADIMADRVGLTIFVKMIDCGEQAPPHFLPAVLHHSLADLTCASSSHLPSRARLAFYATHNIGWVGTPETLWFLSAGFRGRQGSEGVKSEIYCLFRLFYLSNVNLIPWLLFSTRTIVKSREHPLETSLPTRTQTEVN